MQASSLSRARAPRTLSHRAARSQPIAAFNLPQFSLPNLNLPFGALAGALKDPSAERKRLKQELFDLIEPLNRGVNASEEEQAAVEAAAQALEALNPTSAPINSALLNGSWLLRYTTSRTILGTLKPPFLRPYGPIYQILDNRTLRARNRETAPFFNQVSANLEPQSDSRVEVCFDEFKIFGVIPIKAPSSAKGELEITYLDKDLRISRGNRNNLFVLTMDDPTALTD